MVVRKERRLVFNMTTYVHNQKKNNAGFTLVEMIVAVFIFSVVMIVATTAVVTMLDANRKAQATKTVMNNLNFALDAMTRAIRVGTDYECSGDCSSGTENFTFLDSDGRTVTYQFSETKEGKGWIERSIDGEGFLPVTAPDVDINKLTFYLEGGDSGDLTQPRLLIIVRGIAGPTTRTQVAFDLQTMITQRFLDRATP